MLVIPRLTGTILSFMEDGPDRPVRYKLTPRHIVRDSFKVTFGTWSDDTPDDVVLAYKDAAAGFQTRDVRAKLPESESREPYNLTMIGSWTATMPMPWPRACRRATAGGVLLWTARWKAWAIC